MAAHSSVQYVEPNSDLENISNYSEFLTTDGRVYDKVIDPEDYCIGLSISTVLCNRGQSLADGNQLLTLSWENTKENTKVNFMSGTLVSSTKNDSIKDNLNIPYLTTNYADMYVTDIKHYGTTEMIGIKSVNIDFENAVLPVITVQFTDVRGMSLFTPREFSGLDKLTANGVVDASDVAQCFFQCFFKFPYPKFNITVKGFYGKPVSYEVTCDKFETDFNAENGNFDVTVRFIGYKYSFLSDITTEMLLLAPYTDYLGEQYWEEQKHNHHFVVTDAYGQEKEMPRLLEIWSSISDIITNGGDGSNGTTMTREDDTHDEERRQLEAIKNTYTAWYEQLWKEVVKKYGKDNCFIRVLNSGEYDRIIVLIDSNNTSENLSDDAKQFSNEMQKINTDLYALIEEYNSTFADISPLEKLSQDFSKYLNVPLFNSVTINDKNRFIFNGYDESTPISKDIADEMVMNRIGIDGEQNLGSSARHQKTLKTVYNDGSVQKTNCFHIDVDYTSIQIRINKLTADANKSYNEKKRNKDIHNRNIELIRQLGFKPTIENFTKIIMAHVETLMHMIYTVTDEIKADSTRTPNGLGLTTGKEGNLSDVKDDSQDGLIPPFPRVTKSITEDDGTQKQQDVWIGEFDKDQFKEVDLVETFFNAAEKFMQLRQQMAEKIEQKKKDRMDAEKGIEHGVVRYPLTSYDFFLKSNVYGDDVIETMDKFAGAVAVRMFDILSINFFANEFNKDWHKYAKNLGRVEAHNFYKSVDTTSNSEIREWITLDNGVFNSNYITSVMKSTEGKYPWSFDSGSKEAKALFSDDKWLRRYNFTNQAGYNGESYMYQVQNISFDTMRENYNLFNGSNENFSNSDVILAMKTKQIDSLDFKSLTDDYNGHYNLIILDDYTKVKNMMDVAISETFNSYSGISENISNSCSIDNALEGYYKNLFKDEGVSSFCKKNKKFKIKKTTKVRSSIDGAFPLYDENGKAVDDDNGKRILFTSSKQDLEDYFKTEIGGKYVNSCFVSEIFDYKSNGEIDHSTSVLTKKNGFTPSEFLMGIDCINYNTLSDLLKRKTKGDKTFIYLPRFLVLQLGAILQYSVGTPSDINAPLTIGDGLKMQKELRDFASTYLNQISIYSRMILMQYYQDWVSKEFNDIQNKLTSNNSKDNIAVVFFRKSGAEEIYTRALLNQESNFVKELTNKMMLPILLVNGNVNHFVDNNRYCLEAKLYKVENDTVYQEYLDGFIDELNQLLGVDYKADENGNMVRRSKDANNTSDEMRMELYRYLKQIYDKWIPSSTEKDWNYQNFFDKSGADYQFYFIDSYYNKIGDKLLLNPQKLFERIDTLTSYSDIKSNVLSFLSCVYTDNRCMFKCIQNFIDLSKRESMENMFKPLPYSNAFDPKNIRNGQDFVVCYTYEPSKHLDIQGAEYEDDSFMLNNESKTPMSIRTRGAKGDFYTIPAFGVTYGKQYQSFFKKVSVNTRGAIQTEQSIMAKFSILNEKSDKNKNATQGQDMFDIYAGQSFTCTVEMMGCAWVQPMMYFVLLNVPMFRGSYQIYKVSHSITPGNMSTKFIGSRMPNVGNRLVKDVFINPEGDDTEYIPNDAVTFNNAMANNDNDCPYAVFPIFSGSGTLSGDDKQKAKTIMNKLMGKGFNKKAAAGIVGNMCQETLPNFDITSATVDSDNFIAAGLCGWNDRYGNLTHLLEKNSSNFGKPPVTRIASKLGISGVKKKLLEIGTDYQIQFIDETIDQVTVSSKDTTLYSKDKLNACTTPEQAAESFRAAYERGSNSNARQNFARQFYDAYDNTQTVTDQNELAKMNEEIYELFFSAINKTAQNTESMKFELKNSYHPNKNDSNKVMMISAANSQNNAKLAKLFDCILNTPEYFRYVNKLYWVYDNMVTNLIRIDVKLLPKDVPTNLQRVFFYATGSRDENGNASRINVNVNDLSDDCKKSLKKRYDLDGEKKLKCLVPELADPNNLTAITINDCASVVATLSSSLDNSIVNGKIGNWDVMKSVNWLLGMAKEHTADGRDSGVCKSTSAPYYCEKGRCYAYVKRALAEGGINIDGVPAYEAADKLRQLGFKNILTVRTDTVDYESKKLGDITVFDKCSNHQHGHITMWCGNQWVSDFKQMNNRIKKGVVTKCTVWRYYG